MTPMTAVWLLALPLMDTVALIILRIRAGHSPFAADRRHLHHLLLSCGLSDGRATALLLAMALMTGAAGVVAHRLGVPEYLQFYAFLALFGLYCWVVTRFWERRRTVVAPVETKAAERRGAPNSKSVTASTAFRQGSARNEK